MRDFFIWLFTNSNYDRKGVTVAITISVCTYLIIATIVRLIKNSIYKKRAGLNTNYSKFCRACGNLYYGNAFIRHKLKLHLLPIIVVVASIVLYTISVKYTQYNIPDKTSNILFIIAFVLDLLVLVYYTVIFFKDKYRNETAFDSALEWEHMEFVGPNYVTETFTTYEKWDYEPDYAYSPVSSSSYTYDTSWGENAGIALFNILLIIFKLLMLIGTVTVYAIGRMLSMLKTLVIHILFFWAKKPYYRSKAKKYYIKYLKNDVADKNKVASIYGNFNQAEACYNNIIVEVVQDLMNQSFTAVKEKSTCPLFVAPINNKYLIAQKNVSFVCDADCQREFEGKFEFAYLGTKLDEKLQSIKVKRGNGAIWSFKNGNIFVSYNPNGEGLKIEDFSAVPIYNVNHPTNAMDGIVDFIKWMQYKWLKSIKPRNKGNLKINLWNFFREEKWASGVYQVRITNSTLSSAHFFDNSESYYIL